MTTAAVADSAAVTIMSLDHSLNELATAARDPELEPNLDIGSGEPGFGKIADVKSAGSGAFWVLDRFQKSVILFDSSGNRARAFGRRGEGPGEFIDPWVLIRLGTDLVVWQNNPLQTFQRFSDEGRFATSTDAPLEGDWQAHIFRDPVMGFDDYQFSSEDITRRLQARNDSEFVIGLQANESYLAAQQKPVDLTSPPLHYILVNRDLRTGDTLFALRGADLAPGSKGWGLPVFMQRLYTVRPHLAFGAGWYALAHGDSAEARVFAPGGAPMVIIRWPANERRVTSDDITGTFNWEIKQSRNEAEEFDTYWSTAGALARRRMRAREKERLNPVSVAPHLMGMRGANGCLWLAGFRPYDYWDGTARTWLGIDVSQARVLGMIRLPAGERLRDLDQKWAFTTYKDPDNAWHVRRYQLPFNCAALSVP